MGYKIIDYILHDFKQETVKDSSDTPLNDQYDLYLYARQFFVLT